MGGLTAISVLQTLAPPLEQERDLGFLGSQKPERSRPHGSRDWFRPGAGAELLSRVDAPDDSHIPDVWHDPLALRTTTQAPSKPINIPKIANIWLIGV